MSGKAAKMLEIRTEALDIDDDAPHGPRRSPVIGVSAQYDSASDRIVVSLSNGAEIKIEPRLISVLRGADERTLQSISLDPSGLVLNHHSLGVSFPISAMIEQLIMSQMDDITLAAPLGMVVRESVYCCAACETVMGVCKRFKSNSYGARTEDYDYDGE